MKSRKPGVRNYYLCEVTAILAVVCLHLFVCFMSETTELNFVELVL
jgi:succinate dehydrogenase hydrophobic anchor subunit